MSNSTAGTDNNVAQMGTASDEFGVSTDEASKSLASSAEMRRFYRALARAQAIAIFRVMKGEDAEGIKANAIEETNRLNEEAVSLMGRGSPKCPAGTVWDEILQACV